MELPWRATGAEKPPCKYGASCYRRQPEHRMHFCHPSEFSPTSGFASSVPKGENADFLEQQAAILADFEAKKRLSYSPSGGRVVQSSTQLSEGGKARQPFLQTAGYVNQSQDKLSDQGHELPIMLILGGPPGSGKSTFSDALVQRGDVPWTRVCQDIASKGNRGTRQQCLNQAKNALLSKRCVLIDRCNIDRDQRGDFVALAKSMRVSVHALFLDLPFETVVQRAAARVAHEGGVQGAMAEGIIRRFLRTKEMPSLSEGFAHVRVCKSDSDVRTALNQYSSIGAQGLAPFSLSPAGLSRQEESGQTRGGTFSQPKSNVNGSSRGQATEAGSWQTRGGIFSSLGRTGNMTARGGREGRTHDDVMKDPPSGGASGISGDVREGGNGRFGENGLSNQVDDPMEVDFPGFGSAARNAPTQSDKRGFFGNGIMPEYEGTNSKRKLGHVSDDVSNRVSTHGGDNGDQTAGTGPDGNWNGGPASRDPFPRSNEPVEPGGGSGNSRGEGGGSQSAGRETRVAGSDAGAPCFRLAFPSLSTTTFLFDRRRAADVIVEEVLRFLRRGRRGLHLMMVDLDTESDMVCQVKSSAGRKGLLIGPGRRFEIFGGDITKLKSAGAPDCHVLANAANWRLKPGGGGVNAAIYSAAGPEFAEATRACGETLSPGGVLPVELPPSSPLRSEEGVTHVIHVLGPNMNPLRPNCLNGDYEVGERLLRQAYRALFEAFASLGSGRDAETGVVGVRETVAGGDQGGLTAEEGLREGSGTDRGLGGGLGGTGALEAEPSQRSNTGLESELKPENVRLRAGLARAGDSEQTKTVNAFALMMQSAKKRDSGGASKSPEEGKRTKVADSQGTGRISPGTRGQAGRIALGRGEEQKPGGGWSGKGGWSEALRDVALRPEKHRDEVLETHGSAVIIKDLYHKAKVHYLVLAAIDGLDTPYDLRSEHLPLLAQMLKLGRRWAGRATEADSGLLFRFGFHMEPSMRQVHLHVISQDFESDHLKNKKHWNSFTSPFFRDATAVIAEIERDGQMERPPAATSDGLLKMELRCHRCRCVQPNIPRLKAHIRACDAPLPGEKV